MVLPNEKNENTSGSSAELSGLEDSTYSLNINKPPANVWDVERLGPATDGMVPIDKAAKENTDEEQCSDAKSRIVTDADGNTYPEGGPQAWLVVFGAFCALTSSFGILNILGTFQAYLSENQLRNYDEGKIGWISGVFSFLTFVASFPLGPVFDKYGPRWLIFIGSILLILSVMLLGVFTKYWHFMLGFGILGGLGASLLFTPSISAIAHWFLIRRGHATGLAALGPSVGGIVWPLMLQQLFTKLSFAWSTRILGFCLLFLCILANLLIRSRLPPRMGASVWPDLRVFRDRTFTLLVLGIFFMDWGLFIPTTYISSYALSQPNTSTAFSYQVLAFLYAGSCLGRWLAGYIADRVGRFNTQILALGACAIVNFALWLPAGDSVPMICLFAVVFGFTSGSNVSLTPVCVGQLCKTEEYGRYYATCYSLVAFSALTGIPITGSLITACNGSYWGLIVWTGLSYVIAAVLVASARVRKVGFGLKTVY
ncbi:MAG: hypothetical protein M1834_003234 [Cirrosporium novae-zelandiae]|nr:MAG: hypothetical protein M1834_003234 [Cirrosporium novae-zelandiae]